MQSQLTSSLLTAVPVPLVLINGDAKIAGMNEPAVELLGARGTGRSHMTLIRQPALLDCIDAALRTGRAGTARFIDSGAQSDAVYRVVVAPVNGEGIEGVLLTFQDITDLERAGQMRRDFVANVSHELKTPLTALLGFIETLRGAARDDSVARDRFLTIMEREAERMNRLVADLLSLSRVETSERQRPHDPVEISGLLLATVSACSPMAEAAGIEIEVVDSLPPETVVPGDEDQLQQVVSNLLENAIKYGSSGGRVQLSVTRLDRELAFRGPAVRIDVRDFGDGFDPIHIPRITERFYRVDAHRSREKGGTGLGLAICKHIINRHRGRLRIDSEPGEGAQFTILLPLR